MSPGAISSPASPVLLPTPNPIAANNGSPPFAYLVPANFSVTYSDATAVILATPDKSSRLMGAVDTAQGDASAPGTSMTIGGDASRLVADGAGPGGVGYRRVMIVTHNGTTYEFSCIGYLGFDQSTLLTGCSSLVQTVAFAK